MKKRAFTLIELLVVVAILGILAAILFPVFARVRENARRSSCQSNMKQIGIGLMQYLQDFDETTVAPGYATDGATALASSPASPERYKWMDAIQPYVRSEEIFNCPSMPQKTAADEDLKYIYYKNAPTGGSTYTNYGSYSLNATYRGLDSPVRSPSSSYQTKGVGLASTPNVTCSVKLSMFEDASNTAWVAENGWGSLDAASAAVTDPYPFAIISGSGAGSGAGAIGFLAISTLLSTYKPHVLSTSGGYWMNRHLNRINVLYCDGHVKSTTVTSIRNAVSITVGATSYNVNPRLTVDQDG